MKNLVIAITCVTALIACSEKEQSTNKSATVAEYSTEEAELQKEFPGYSSTADEYTVSGNTVSNIDTSAYLWNPRGKSKEQIAERAKYLTSKSDTNTDDKVISKYREKFTGAIVINTLMPTTVHLLGNTPESYGRGLQRNMDAGVTAVSASAHVSFWSAEDSVKMIEASDKVNESMGVGKYHNTHDIRNAKKDGRMVLTYHSQGLWYGDKDLSGLKQLKEMGMSSVNFVYNSENVFATGGVSHSGNKSDTGVTDLGKEAIKFMNDNGIIVDVSHSSDQTAIDAAKYSTKPIMASHSNSSVVMPTGRNMSDEAIIAVGNTNGIVCSNGIGVFLTPDSKAQPEDIVTHILHTANLIGKDKVCYASDYTHNLEDAMKIQVPMVAQYPPEKGLGAPSEMAGIEDVWAIVALLQEEHNWSDDEIRGFLGENVMRVYKANWD